jgi:O-antigen/teichoic acid export membrane protein
MPNFAARLRQRLGPVWGAALLLFVAQRFGDAVNAFIGIWLVPRYVPQGELGAVLPLAQVAAFVAMPLSILLTPYAKLLNVHAERGEPGKVKAMFRDASLLALAVLLLTLALSPLFFPWIFRHFGIQNGNLALAIVLSAVIGALAPIFSESLRALRRFGVVSALSAISAPLRLAVMWIALPFRGLTGYFVGQASAPAFQSGVALLDFLRRHRGVRCEPYFRDDRRVFLAFAVPLAVSTLAGNLRGMAEMMPMALVPSVESAAYYQITRFTEIASYLGLTLVFVLFPVVSGRHERGEDTRGVLLRTMWGSLALGLAFTAALALAARPLFGAVGFLRPYADFTGFVLPLGAIASVRVASACFTTHEMACSRFRFLRYTVPISLAEAAVLHFLFRTDGFPWRLWHVVAAMLATTLLCFLGNLAELYARKD